MILQKILGWFLRSLRFWSVLEIKIVFAVYELKFVQRLCKLFAEKWNVSVGQNQLHQRIRWIYLRKFFSDFSMENIFRLNTRYVYLLHVSRIEMELLQILLSSSCNNQVSRGLRKRSSAERDGVPSAVRVIGRQV